jgi:hypothetical protein
MNFEQAIQAIQDNLIVIGEIERRTSAVLREQSEILHEHNLHFVELLEFRRRIEQNLAESTEKQGHIDRSLSELTDKLNGLIGSMDGLRPPPA